MTGRLRDGAGAAAAHQTRGRIAQREGRSGGAGHTPPLPAGRAKPLTELPRPARRLRRGRQVIRQVQIVCALSAAHRGLTAAQVRDAVGGGCCLRTIYRDLEQLEEAGFAVLSEDQRWRLHGSALRCQLPVDSSELLAILLAEQTLRPLMGTDLGAPLGRLRAKLLSLVSPKVRGYCEELSRSFAVTFSAPAGLGEHEASADTLREALDMQHAVRLEYSAPGKVLEVRDVEPYATWYTGGRLYLVARCRRAQALRTFAVARVRSATILDDPFEPDPRFDLAEYVQRGFGVYHGAVHRVVIELGPEVAHLARERVYHASQRVQDLPGGVARLTMDVAGLPEIAAWVAGFGGKARAVEPVELVEMVHELHDGGLRVHGARRTSKAG